MAEIRPGRHPFGMNLSYKIKSHNREVFTSKDAARERNMRVARVGKAIECLPMFVDQSVFEGRVIDISRGDSAAGLELHRDDLKRLIRHATVSEIAKAD